MPGKMAQVIAVAMIQTPPDVGCHVSPTPAGRSPVLAINIRDISRNSKTSLARTCGWLDGTVLPRNFGDPAKGAVLPDFGLQTAGVSAVGEIASYGSTAARMSPSAGFSVPRLAWCPSVSRCRRRTPTSGLRGSRCPPVADVSGTGDRDCESGSLAVLLAGTPAPVAGAAVACRRGDEGGGTGLVSPSGRASRRAAGASPV